MNAPAVPPRPAPAPPPPGRRSRRLVRGGAGLALGVLVLGWAASAPGCAANEVHVFTAYEYDPVALCLGPADAVDLLQGPDKGPCGVLRCWEDPSATVYVTDQMCDAPPDYTEHTGDPVGTPCYRAILAFNGPNHTPCPAPPDAGS